MGFRTKSQKNYLVMLFINALLFAAPSFELEGDDVTYIVTFDGAKDTTFNWRETNDPVMGGKSIATFSIDQDQKFGTFNGTCAIVPSLKAPGFCSASAHRGLFSPRFADVSAHINGSLQLRIRTSTPKFAGFHVAFSAKDVPHTSPYGGGSFKAPFTTADTTDWQTVQVPFTSFSYDWSPFTGSCATKDPTGQQHHCCTADDAFKYCPTAAYLSSIEDIEVWAEGTEGDFTLDITWIGASD